MAIEKLNVLNKTFISFTPNFRSERAVLLENKPDTVEISRTIPQKKEEMSTGKKLLLGIGGTGLAIYGALVTKRAVSRPSLEALKKDFSEIFRREVKIDEIPEMLKKYKELMKIEDPKEYCEKMYKQVKKDYGYENLNLDLALLEETGGQLGGGWHSGQGTFMIFYKNVMKNFDGKFNKITKARFLDIFFHEFQHVKQSEYCMRTNPEKYFEAISKEETITNNYINAIRTILSRDDLINQAAKNMNITREEYINLARNDLSVLETKGYKALPAYVREVEQQIVIMKKRFNDLFGGFEKFKPGSKEYEQGEAYIENYGNYIEIGTDLTKYMEQPIEKEAYNVGLLSLKIPERLKSIWNIFDVTNYKKAH